MLKNSRTFIWFSLSTDMCIFSFLSFPLFVFGDIVRDHIKTTSILAGYILEKYHTDHCVLLYVDKHWFTSFEYAIFLFLFLQVLMGWILSDAVAFIFSSCLLIIYSLRPSEIFDCML